MVKDEGYGHTTAATRNGASRRLSGQQVTFRLLCHRTNSGATIGKSGSIVKLMEKETGTKIRMEDIAPFCQERVICIFGPDSPKKIIVLKSSNGKTGMNVKDSGVEAQVSPAQHGLIRVLERVLEVEANTEEISPSTGVEKGLVTCRLLTDASHIGYLMGKGGKKVKQIEDDSGAKIRVSVERCPPCALETDELIQIRGDSLAVKKAVVAVSQSFQESSSLEGSKPFVAAPNGAVAEPYTSPHQTACLPPRVKSSVDYGSRSYSKQAEEEVVFRLLCSNDKVGGLIGKGGSIINALQDETGSYISVAAPVAGSYERVIHISAIETLESEYSRAQNAVIQVFTKSVGNKRLELPSKIRNRRPESGANAEARLLVPLDHIGRVVGKGGSTISEMRRVSHTSMWVLYDQVPPCAAENDTVVQINGKVENVQKALFIVTSSLRDTFFPDKTTKTSSRQATSTAEKLSNSWDHSLSSRMMGGERLMGVVDTGRRGENLTGSLEHGSVSKSAIVKSTTLEISVPKHVVTSIRGDKESNLKRLRQISGARVTVQEPLRGSNEGPTIIISGTPDQAHAAQSVLHAFIVSSGES